MTFQRVIASGNNPLTQVKDNQPGLRRRLELGTAGRKPRGFAKTETSGRNRWGSPRIDGVSSQAGLLQLARISI